MFTDLITRLHSLVLRRREERELDEELRFHVAMAADEARRRGASAAEAERRGRIALGGIERTKEEVRDARGTRLFDELARDVAFAVRTLARTPGFALVVILTLALGIGGTTAVFSAVDAVLLQPLPYDQPGQLVRLYQYYGTDRDTRSVVTPVHVLAYRSQLASFEHLASALTYDAVGMDISSAGRPERIRVLPVSADYFDVLRVHPTAGRVFLRSEETGAPSVILSHALWERAFHGDPAVIGQPFVLSGVPYTVVGIMPADFTDPLVPGVAGWVPLDLRPGLDASNAGNHYLDVIGRLRSGVPLAAAQAELNTLDATLGREYADAKDVHGRLYPLKDVVVGSANRSLELMLGAVALVLLIVCVNVATLLLVRGSQRARELALRAALGARRVHLIRQMLVESVLLALAGGVAGLIVARLGMSAIVALGAGSVPRLEHLSLEPRLLAFAIGVSLLCAIVFGLAPSLRAARAHPIDALRDESRSATGGGAQTRLRAGLVVAQVALAFVLVVAAGLLLLSFQRLHSVDLGIKTHDALVFELHLPAARYDSTARATFYDAFAARIERLPGVRAAGGTSRLPATGSYNAWGTTPLTGPLAGTNKGLGSPEHRVVSGHYFRALGIPLLAGRLFDSRDALGTPCRVVVSASLVARLFPGTDPIGQRLGTSDAPDCTVIGVVGDVAIDAEGASSGPTVYHAHAQFAGNRNWALTQVVSASVPPQTLVPAIRLALAQMDPLLVMYRPMSLDDAIGAGTAQRTFTLTILVAFALVALALAALGLFGALSYAVRLRSREFGVRMALGAERGMIQRLVLRQGLTVTLGGVLIGAVGAAAASQLMASMVFQVRPLDPLVLAGAALFIVGVGALAASLPARRATSVDPRSILQ